MSAIIYSLCALTAALCAVLLLRGYSRTRITMLFWSGLCFVGLTLSNTLLVLDRIVYPTAVDLSTARLGAGLVALLLLIYGLIMGED